MALHTKMRCAVIGVGVLGTTVCQQLLLQQQQEETSRQFFSELVGITKTKQRHEEIQQQIISNNKNHRSFQLQTFEEAVMKQDTDESALFDHVLFCAPPSGFENYPMALQQALQIWKGPCSSSSNDSSFVFTSSGAVYGNTDTEGPVFMVNEDTPVVQDPTQERVHRLVQAEQTVLQAGGTCLRLAGLYNLDRGAHNFWITSTHVKGDPGGLINQLHYDDAAAACVAALKTPLLQGKALVVSDEQPLTRRQICESALKAKKYKDYSMPTFASTREDPHGKQYDCSTTRRLLGWNPRYSSFATFMEENS